MLLKKDMKQLRFPRSLLFVIIGIMVMLSLIARMMIYK